MDPDSAENFKLLGLEVPKSLYWCDGTGKFVQMTSTAPPSYTPAGWNRVDGWEVEETENKTVVISILPSALFCSGEYGYIGFGYVLSKSNPKLCNKERCQKHLEDEGGVKGF